MDPRRSATSIAVLAISVALITAACAGSDSGAPSAGAAAAPDAPQAAAPLDAGEAPFLRRPVDRQAPGFTLTDHHGRTVSLSDLEGSWVLMDWVYTNCLTVCPLLTSEMNIVRNRLGDDVGDGVQFVSISFDPTVDTPEALKAHAVSVGGNVPGWSWLTGSREETDAVAASYGVSYDPAAAISGVPQFDHTALMVVIDPSGRERYRYFGTGWAADVVETLGEARAANTSEPKPAAVALAAGGRAAAVKPGPMTATEASLLTGAIALAWEDWELEPGIVSQVLYQFPNTGSKTAYIDFLRAEADAAGLETSAGFLSAMRYEIVPWPDRPVKAIGYTTGNIAVVLEGETAADIHKALAVIDDDWCCSSPE